VSGCGEPALELRRVAFELDPAALLPHERERLGCDPCVRLDSHPGYRAAPALVGPPSAELRLAHADLLRAEVRERPALTASRMIYDLSLIPHERAHESLARFREQHPTARMSVELDGGVIGVVPTAPWPDKVWIGRFREREAAEAYPRPPGLPVEFVPWQLPAVP
jgi:hypothetical protein